LPLAPNVPSSINYCEGDSINPLTAIPQVGGVINWYSDAGLSNLLATGNSYIPNLVSGINAFYVTEESSNGCEGPYTYIQITLYDQSLIDAGEDVTICFGESVQLQAIGGVKYLWLPAAGLSNTNISNPIASPESTTKYIVAVTTNGCTYRDSVNVTVVTVGCDWHIYNVFSPNGDGDNDTWIIDGIQRYSTNRIIIFNRWEDIVNEFENYDNEGVVWDGKNKAGIDLPNGTYFYIIEVGEDRFSGWVQIAR